MKIFILLLTISSAQAIDKVCRKQYKFLKGPTPTVVIQRPDTGFCRLLEQPVGSGHTCIYRGKGFLYGTGIVVDGDESALQNCL